MKPNQWADVFASEYYSPAGGLARGDVIFLESRWFTGYAQVLSIDTHEIQHIPGQHWAGSTNETTIYAMTPKGMKIETVNPFKVYRLKARYFYWRKGI